MKKNSYKSVSDLWMTYDLAKMIIVGITLGVSLALLDYYNIPSQLLTAIPNKVVWAILGGVVAIAAVWLLSNHCIDLFRIAAVNPVDIAALLIITASIAYIPIRWRLIGFARYTYIALYISGALSLLLLIRIGVRAQKYAEAEGKGSNLVDLKDLYDNKISRVSKMPILIRENDVDVDNWEKAREASAGLLLWGNVGSGKSYIAGCIANALLDKGVPVMMTNFARLLNKLTDLYSGDRNAYIDSFNAYQLLIIDDLGVERNSEFAREQVFNIIDSRYRSQLPMIVTTNLSLKKMQNSGDLARFRIYDRILERCIPIRVSDQNIRNLNKEANLKQVKQLLGNVQTKASVDNKEIHESVG